MQVLLPSIAPHETAQLGAVVCCTSAGSLQLEVAGAYDTPDHLKTLKKQLCSVRLLTYKVVDGLNYVAGCIAALALHHWIVSNFACVHARAGFTPATVFAAFCGYVSI